MMTEKLSRIFIISTLIVALSIPTTLQQNFIDGVLKFLQEAKEQFRTEPKDVPKQQLLQEYDFIIVGAGSAGCVLANRLTENSNWNVLLIEAGGSENYLMDIPFAANYLQDTEANWGYLTEPSDKYCLGATNHQCPIPRGKVMGGSSVLNYMVFTRGNRRDYDRWAEMGNTGWSYKDVLPYFKKVENFTVNRPIDHYYHNDDGPVQVSYNTFQTPLVDAFNNASIQYGIRPVEYNGKTQTGVSKLQLNMRDGVRDSASRTYLHPIHQRPNLHVKKYSMVTKILINPENKEAYGVEFVNSGKIYRVLAKKEVIVSAGAINSPQLLMLSGVGPAEHLDQFGIPVLSNLKVGYNLVDHVTINGFRFTIDEPYGILTSRVLLNLTNYNIYFNNHSGPLASQGTETLVFYDFKDPSNPDGYPDVELLLTSFTLTSELNFQDSAPIFYKNAFRIWPVLLKPKSRGRVMLKDAKYWTKPLIFPNYFDHPDDMKTLIKSVRLSLNIAEQPALEAIGTKFHHIPIKQCTNHPFATDEYFDCMIRHLTSSMYHQSGTCKMGPTEDKEAVVDSKLRVYGIKNLRVIDASIMPEIIAGHTNAPIYMIAEKGADMIKEEWYGK